MDDQIVVIIFASLRTRDVISFSCVSKNHSRISNLDCVLRTILLNHDISQLPRTDHIPYSIYRVMSLKLDNRVKTFQFLGRINRANQISLKSLFLQDAKKWVLPLNVITNRNWKEWRLHDWQISKVSGYHERSEYLSDWLKIYISNAEAVQRGQKIMPALQWVHAPKAKLHIMGSYHQIRCMKKTSVNECTCELACLLRALYPGVSDSDKKYSLNKIFPRYRSLKKLYVKNGMMFYEEDSWSSS